MARDCGFITMPGECACLQLHPRSCLQPTWSPHQLPPRLYTGGKGSLPKSKGSLPLLPEEEEKGKGGVQQGLVCLAATLENQPEGSTEEICL